MESEVKAPKSFLEKLKDNLPVLSLGIISFSTLRLIVYYHYFGIDIVSYIEFTEALTLSTPTFYYAMCFNILGLVLGMGLIGSERNVIDHDNLVQDGKTFKERIFQTNAPIAYYLLVYAYPLMLAGFSGWAYFIKRVDTIELIWSLVLSMVLISFADVVSNEIRFKLKVIAPKLSYYNVKLFIYGIALFSLMLISARNHAHSIVYSKAEGLQKVAFTFNGRSIKTTESYRYVGKTKSYIFFYNSVTGYADVFTMSEVKSLSIRDSEPTINQEAHDKW